MILFTYGMPIIHTRAAKSIDQNVQIRPGYGFHIDNLRQFLYIQPFIVIRNATSPLPCFRFRQGIPGFQQAVCFFFYGLCNRTVCRPAAYGIVLNTATVGRIMRRRYDNTVTPLFRTVFIIAKNGTRYGRGRYKITFAIRAGYNLIVSQDIQGRLISQLGQIVRIRPYKYRTGSSETLTQIADSLNNRAYM